MHSLYVLLILFIVVAIYGYIEFAQHQKRIYSIPIRIHVNGTRGKSSVTRLIGAGLRAGGIRTITKVTGTYPRLILEDGSEVQVYRKSDPNILEQVSIVKFAASRQVKALVVECMALQPRYQWITENQMIHATIGVITNVRLDHVDVMGHTLEEIATVLGETIPPNAHLFTAEDRVGNLLKNMAEQKKSSIYFTDPTIVSSEEMKGFGYIEHRENVALALSVCEHLGIPRQVALAGMYRVTPDPGALKCYRIQSFGKQIIFFNAFAANDPQSTYMIWEKIRTEIGITGKMIVILNTRQDRLDRARQLAEMVGTRFANRVDYLILIGQSTDVVEHLSVKNGFPEKKIINTGWTKPEAVFEEVLSLTGSQSTVLAIGNMGGMGAPVAEYFEHRSSA